MEQKPEPGAAGGFEGAIAEPPRAAGHITSRLNRNQIRSFWAAWSGWTMDGMDSFIYSLVLVLALRELLPRSGIAPSAANVGYYGGFLFALFMIGYGISIIWGPIADRLGRVRTMMLSILAFSLFTLLAGFSIGVWSLAICRFLAGIGIGGEWSIGAALVSEDWPEERRTMGAALMHTGYYFGFFLASAANYFLSGFGWRYMFVLGGAPALLIAFIRNNVNEPSRWKDKQKELGERWRIRDSFLELFSAPYRRRTILNSAYLIVSLIGLWAGSIYTPSAMTFIAEREGQSAVRAAQLASYSSALLAIGTILKALVVPFLAGRLGRRTALGILYIVRGGSIWAAFGHVFYMRTHAIPWFMVCAFLLGVGGANFIVYSFWLPEQYGTECRASAFAFTTNFGRFAAAAFTFLVGAGVRHFRTFGTPVALTGLVFVIGIMLLPFGVETKGKPLPA